MSDEKHPEPHPFDPPREGPFEVPDPIAKLASEGITVTAISEVEGAEPVTTPPPPPQLVRRRR